MNLARCFTALLVIFLLQISTVNGQTVLGNIVPPSGSNFTSTNNLVFSNNGSVGWIGDNGGNRVIAFDARSGTVLRTLNNIVAPGNLSLSPNENILAVVNVGTSNVTLINTQNFQVGQFASAQPANFSSASNVVFNSDGSRAFIADFQYSNLIAFNPNTGELLRSIGLVSGSNPSQISVTPDGRMVAIVATGTIGVTNNFISIVNTETLLPVGTGRVLPNSAAFQPANNVVFADNGIGFAPSFGTNSVIVFNPSTLATIAAIPVGSGPGHISLSPDGRTLAVVNLLSRTISLIDPSNLRVFATVAPSPVGFADFSNVDFSRNGATGFIASRTTNEVIAFNAIDGTVKDRFPVGTDPVSVSSNFARGLLYVLNTRSKSISVLGYVLNFPVVRQSGSNFTGIAIANPSGLPTNVVLTGYGNRGDLFRSSGAINSRLMTLNANQQIARLGSEIFNINSPLEGWMQASTLDDKIFGFFLLGNAGLTAVEGAVAASNLNSNLVFTRVLDGGVAPGFAATTEISVVNPSVAQVRLDLSLFDQGGRNISRATRALPALGKVTESVGSLFPDAARPIMGGHIEVTATGGGVVGFELITLNDSVFGLPAQTLTTESLRYSAQFATGRAGDQWFTELNLVNTNATAINATITLVGDDGQPISVSGVTNPISVGVPTKGSLIGRASELFGFPDETVDDNLTVGSVIVQANSGGVLGDVVFGEATQRRFVAGLPLESQPASDMIFSHVAEGDAGGVSYFTGLALLNPNAFNVRASVRVFSNTGAEAGRADLTLPAGGRTSRLVREIVSAAAGQVGGYVRVTTDGGRIAAFEVFGSSPVRFLAPVPPQMLR